MGLRFYPRKTDRVQFVTSVDDAVDVSDAEKLDAYKAYLDSHDISGVSLVGEPVVFHLRPLTVDVLEYAIRDTSGLSPSMHIDVPASRRMFQLCCEDITGPGSERLKRPLTQMHYGYQGLSAAIMANIPSAACVEAASMLQSTLPGDDDETELDKPIESAGLKKK
jgi:hypothetical protein